MPLNKFSRFVLADLESSDRVSSDEVVDAVGQNFVELVLTGNLIEDVSIVKRAEGERPSGLLPIRLANGRLISPFTLRNLLSVKMQEIAKSKMGKGGRLNYRSGRLLRSASVEPQIVLENNTVSLKFRYMFAPYEVFDPKADVVTDGGYMKGRLASRMRSPRLLFTESLQEAARQVLYRGYNIRVAQVGVNKR